jgi:hypothetical protein
MNNSSRTVVTRLDAVLVPVPDPFGSPTPRCRVNPFYHPSPFSSFLLLVLTATSHCRTCPGARDLRATHRGHPTTHVNRRLDHPRLAQDAALLSFRQAANFRSVTRNDPSVTDIIETSVYSTIYHYDDQGDWEKQKMEGSTFIVHRYVTLSLRHLLARLTFIYPVLSMRWNRTEW